MIDVQRYMQVRKVWNKNTVPFVRERKFFEDYMSYVEDVCFPVEILSWTILVGVK